jgi:hypothetical protein
MTDAPRPDPVPPARAIEAIQLAYRLLHFDDPDVSSAALGNELAAILREHMGDAGFQEFTDEYGWDEDDDVW